MALAFVDAHHHFQDIDAHSYPWLRPGAPEGLEGDLSPIRRNYLPPDYAKDMADVTLVASVHVQNGWNPSDPLGETRWLDSLATDTGRPDAIVAYADLSDPAVDTLLAAHAAHPRVRGIRQILNWHPDPRLRVAARPDLMRDPGWRSGFARIARYGLSFDLQIYWPQMDMAAELARDFPDTQIVLDHFGMPIDRSAAGLANWADALTRLADAPNVTVKLSGFGLGHPAWTVEDTAPILHRTLAVFGPDRTMVGTNLPVDRLFAPTAQTFRAFEAVIASLPAADAAMVLRQTAARVYRL